MPSAASPGRSLANEPPSIVAVPVIVARIGSPAAATTRVTSASSPRRIRTAIRPMTAPPGTVMSGSRTYIALVKRAAERRRGHDLDAVGLERRDEPGVLRLGARDVGRLAPGPVPAAVGIDERAQILVPGVGADPVQRRPGRAHEHAAQAPDLVRRAPRAAPDGLDLVVERRLGRRRHPRLMQLGGHSARRLRQTSSTSRTLAVR